MKLIIILCLTFASFYSPKCIGYVFPSDHLQQNLNAMFLSCDTVIFKAGTYKILKPIIIPDGKVVVAESEKAILLFPDTCY